jgi:hypothetical protein
VLVLVLVLVLLLVLDSAGTDSITITITSTRKRPGLLSQPGLLNYYPAGAVKVDIPFPFGNGRTTVASASDFQLRHVIFDSATKPP